VEAARFNRPQSAIRPVGAPDFGLTVAEPGEAWGQKARPDRRSVLGFGEAMVADWQGAGLIKASVLKPVFTTIEHGLVLRVMGHLSVADIKTLRELVADVIG